MIYRIESEKLAVEISDLGAELMSIKGKKTNTEYLWQGNPEIWGDRALVLFPICGRVYQGKYTWQGKTYEMGLHGFARHSIFTVEKHDDNLIVFSLKASNQTKEQYPFEFTFKVSYEVVGDEIWVNYDVNNDKEEVLPFACGGHPGFNVPFLQGERFEDYYIEFSQAKDNVTRIVTSPKGFYLGIDNPYTLKDGKIIELKHELFDPEAIFLTGVSNSVSIKSKVNDRKITVSYDDVTHVGFWHMPKTQASYVCIEPWHGIPSFEGKVDDFSTKNEMIKLEKGGSYNMHYEIKIEE